MSTKVVKVPHGHKSLLRTTGEDQGLLQGSITLSTPSVPHPALQQFFGQETSAASADVEKGPQ